ncbi:MAG: XdhC family protein [bacterium]|nr:XdhC family protein [bacterium]
MAAPSVREFLDVLHTRLGAGERIAVASVISVDGSASAQPGSKAIIDARGARIFGWVGGGCAETEVRDAALQVLTDERPRVIRIDLNDEVLGVGMPCGGFMEVFIEPMIPPPNLVVLGHGRIAELVASLGSELGFFVCVNDPLANETEFPRADERVVEDLEYAKLECDGAYVVIATQHRSDYEALRRVLRQQPSYVGLVASRKRSALLFERLREDGFANEVLRRVSAPAGLDLGAATPEEIALSIVAELSQKRRGGRSSGRPLVEVKGAAIAPEPVQANEETATSGRRSR